MICGDREYDRVARLVRLQHLLFQHPEGLTKKQIAEHCGVSTKTTGRDLNALDLKLKIPIWADKGKWGITEGYFLPFIYFNQPEAMTIFIATRLLLSYSNAYNPHIISTFTKLNSVVNPPLRGQIEKTLDWMQKLKKDESFIRIMDKLTTALIKSKKTRIKYLTLGEKTPKDRIIEPYFIQPAALEHGNYVIAYCHLARQVRTFKIERIKSIEVLDETYKVPDDFNAIDYLGSAWGISVYGETETVKLRFKPVIGSIAHETMWHPSQVTEMQNDGSAIVTFILPVTTQLESFILGWGEKVEVMEPDKLRNRILKIARKTSDLYKKKR